MNAIKYLFDKIIAGIYAVFAWIGKIFAAIGRGVDRFFDAIADCIETIVMITVVGVVITLVIGAIGAPIWYDIYSAHRDKHIQEKAWVKLAQDNPSWCIRHIEEGYTIKDGDYSSALISTYCTSDPEKKHVVILRTTAESRCPICKKPFLFIHDGVFKDYINSVKDTL